MNMRVVTGTALAALAAAAVPGQAAADATPAVDFELGLSSRVPATPTGVTIHAEFKNPSNPGAKPSAQRTVVIAAPGGTVFHAGAFPACTASDAQLLAQGESACPPDTRVGTGTVRIISGAGAPIDPFDDDVVIFNSGDGLIELFTNTGSGKRTAVGRRSLTGPGTLSETPAPTPGGPPDGESAVTVLDLRLDAGPAGSPFVTTPATCPADGRWRSTIDFTTADGNSYSAPASTPCRAAGPRTTVGVVPGHVRTGRSTTFRVSVSASPASCAHGATVRLGRARAVTDRRGRASLRVRFTRPVRHRLHVTKRGCAPATVVVPALRR
jgi:hypothetical protein